MSAQQAETIAILAGDTRDGLDFMMDPGCEGEQRHWISATNWTAYQLIKSALPLAVHQLALAHLDEPVTVDSFDASLSQQVANLAPRGIELAFFQQAANLAASGRGLGRWHRSRQSAS